MHGAGLGSFALVHRFIVPVQLSVWVITMPPRKTFRPTYVFDCRSLSGRYSLESKWAESKMPSWLIRSSDYPEWIGMRFQLNWPVRPDILACSGPWCCLPAP